MIPKISVIIPAFNAEDFLNESVSSVLKQTYKNFELIIVDDSSTDKTKEIAKRFAESDERVKIITNKINRKRAGSINRGIKFSSGEFITFLDADDKYLNKTLEMQYSFMRKNPKIDMIYGATKFFGFENGRTTPLNLIGLDLRKLLLERKKLDLSTKTPGQFFGIGGGIASCSVMIKRNVFKKCKFDEKLRNSEDYDLWFQIIGKGFKVKALDKILYLYRTHDGQKSKNKKNMDDARNTILKKLKRGVYFK